MLNDHAPSDDIEPGDFAPSSMPDTERWSHLADDFTPSDDIEPGDDIAPGSVPDTERRSRLAADLGPGFTQSLAELRTHPIARTTLGRQLVNRAETLLSRLFSDDWKIDLFGVPSQIFDALEALTRLARRPGAQPRLWSLVLAQLSRAIAELHTRRVVISARHTELQAPSPRHSHPAPNCPNAPPCAYPRKATETRTRVYA